MAVRGDEKAAAAEVFAQSRCSLERRRRSEESTVVQSGEKDIVIAILMPRHGRGVGFERDLCGFCVESELEFAGLALDAWLSSVCKFLGKFDIESAVPEFSRPVGKFHHPDIWNAAGGSVSAVCA